MSATGVISITPTARQRRWWAALAIVALALLSLRPACDVWLSHWGKGDIPHQALAHNAHSAATHEAPAHAPHDEPCCETIKGSTLVKPADMLQWRTAQGSAPVLLQSMRAAFPAATPLLHALTVSVIPPGSPPYYVRSARILR